MNSSHEQQPRDACAACRRWLLNGGPGPHAVSAHEAAYQVHLQGCAECRAYAGEMLAWRRVGGRLRGRVTAPPEVRQRIFRELALARTRWLQGDRPMRRRRLWFGAMVSAALMLAVVGVLQLPRVQPPVGADALSAVVEDHWRDLHHEHIDSTDPAIVQRWLAAHLPMPTHVMAMQGATLQGARLCFLRGRLGAVLRYRVGSAKVSYYVMPTDARTDAMHRDRTALQQEAAQGYNVVLWQEHGLLHALVGELPRSRLLKLAASCHPVKLSPPPA